MGLKQIQQSSAPIVKWIGAHDSQLSVSRLQHKNAFFYAKCIIGPLTLNVGDFVLVSNADAPDPDSVEGCDIAKILNLYELREMSNRDPSRAIVQWYSRPECIPHKHFDSDEICVDFGTELIEEHRPYDSDISLETVFSKCSVIYGPVETSAPSLLETFKGKRKHCTMFVCRYKFIKVKNSYRLVPLQFENDEVMSGHGGKSTTEKNGLETSFSSSKKLRQSSLLTSEESPSHKQRCSVSGENIAEFIDLNYFNAEDKVSPIKIVGGRSVVRLSAKRNNSSRKSGEQNNLNDNYLPVSPLGEQNVKVTPQSKAAAAKRNLNLCLDYSEADNTADYDSLNYSIVKSNPDPQLSHMKIKLRLSERRHSVRLASMDENRLSLGQQELSAYSDMYNSADIYQTPTKKLKEINDDTPLNPRKSILKVTTTKNEGTPKRSIKLSSIVEKRIFEDDEIINTPKSTKSRKSIVSTAYGAVEKTKVGQPTPKKNKQTTSTKCTSNTKSANPEIQGTLTASQKLKMIRSGEIRPALENRIILQEDQNKTNLQIARERLHVAVVPKSLPCREREFENIYTFLESKIQDQCGGCMYVSGVPGTGKTATVTGVIRSLQKKVFEEELPSFDFLEINGMRLSEPRQAYVHIYRQLTGKTLSWGHAHALLEKRFTTSAPRRITTVLLVDELDILCNRRQDVVYNILDWPTKIAARLVVVTIANTMDLPERLLMGKVTSRLGLTRLTFQPYTHKQLQEIVTERLRGSDAFMGDAVQLVARKVAAVSGDARRALDICRRAIEIADADTIKIGANAVQCVNMLHVQQALAEMIATAKVQAIKNCSRLEKIFLQAVVAEVNRTGVEEAAFFGVYSQIETISAFMGALVPTPGRALRICSKLAAERLLICEHSRNDIFQKILLNVSMDDIHYALKVNNN